MAANEHVDMATSGADRTAERLAAVPGIRRAPSPKLQQFMLARFLDAETCTALMAVTDGNARPSTIADPNGDEAFRTSSTCDLDHRNPLVVTVNERLHELTGIPLEYGEPLQGQRYAVGQEFKGHTDYFEPDGVDFDRFCSVAGNRTWTMMVYLNEPEAGGATRFKAVDKIIQPETGKLVAWNNRRPDGSLNPATLHHGMKVRAGTKYVITKWYRERPWG